MGQGSASPGARYEQREAVECSETSTIPEPVLHSYSSERKEALHIPSKVYFYEEATYWNTDWGTRC